MNKAKLKTNSQGRLEEFTINDIAVKGVTELKKLVEDTIVSAHKKEEDLREKLKIANGAKGGLQKEINKLQKEIEELKSDRYKVRKIRPTKAINQKMKTSTHQNGSVKSTLKEIEKDRC